MRLRVALGGALARPSRAVSDVAAKADKAGAAEPAEKGEKAGPDTDNVQSGDQTSPDTGR